METLILDLSEHINKPFDDLYERTDLVEIWELFGVLKLKQNRTEKRKAIEESRQRLLAKLGK